MSMLLEMFSCAAKWNGSCNMKVVILFLYSLQMVFKYGGKGEISGGLRNDPSLLIISLK